MSRPTGLAKTGGRKKGTPNKSTLDLHETLGFHGLDVPSKIIECLPELSIEKRVDALMELMQYLYPKRKALEQSSVVTVDSSLDNKSPEELRAIHSQVFSKLHGFDINSEEQRRDRIKVLSKFLAETEDELDS